MYYVKFNNLNAIAAADVTAVFVIVTACLCDYVCVCVRVPVCHEMTRTSKNADVLPIGSKGGGGAVMKNEKLTPTRCVSRPKSCTYWR